MAKTTFMLEQRVRFQLFWKRLIGFHMILAERLIRAFWRPVLWSFMFFALWLFQIPDMIGFGLGILALTAYLAGMIYLSWRDIAAFKWPTQHAINRRLEADSGLEHRPASTLRDKPIFDEENPLWIVRHRQLITILERLRLPAIRTGINARDPHGIRFAILVVFMAGLFHAGPTALERVGHGLTPFHFAGREDQSAYSIWVKPPDYTDIAHIYLSEDNAGEPIDIPEGSHLHVKAFSSLGAPSLVMGSASMSMEKLDGRNYALETQIQSTDRLEIKQFFMTRASWPVTLITDTLPTIAPQDKPVEIVMPAADIRVPLIVFDDYGVQELKMTMTIDPLVEDHPHGAPVTEFRTIVSMPQEAAEIKPSYNLASHSWAGLPAIFTFEAFDAKGQSETTKIRITLPEREFTHPVAQELIAIRKQLAWSPGFASQDIADELFDIMARPGRYHEDKGIFLALRSATSRLQHAPSTQSSIEVIDMLWDIAIELEDGNLGMAARAMQDAQRDLENALKEGVGEEELSALMSDLQQALSEYFQELAKLMMQQMQQNPQMQPMIPSDMAQMMNPEGLGQFMRELEQAMRDGDTQKAREMLSQLQNMMNQMPSTASAGNSLNSMPQDMQEMMEGMNELQELIKQQESLRDATQALADMMDRMSIDSSGSETEQEALRLVLGQLMMDAGEAFPEIPGGMGEAERAMAEAAKSLGGNQPGEAVGHQNAALDHLRDAMQSMSQQMQARMRQMSRQGMMSFMAPPQRLDPMGRPMRPNGDGQNSIFPWANIEVPDEDGRRRARDIERIIRDRSGELDRPYEERDYFRRLLKKF